MSKGIRLSEKHGVNPTIPLCFWCGKEKNEVVLLGKLPGDAEAPRTLWIPGDYEPCEECKKTWKLGIPLIEMDDKPMFDNQPPYYDHFPTGRVCIVKGNLAEKLPEEAIKNDIAFVERGVIDFLIESLRD